MSLFEILSQVAGGDTTRTISRQIGADEDTTRKAISAALPTLVTALSRNAAASSGAGNLASALDRDHDGSILDDVAGFLQGGGASSLGDGILGHILGNRRGSVESGIGKASGLNQGQVGQLLALLAPLVMGALGRQKRQEGLGAGDLSTWLQGQSAQIGKQAPGALGAVTSLLDRDGDGQVGDELMELGGSLLGGLFGKR